MLIATMNNALFYGIVLALANIVLTLLSYFLGFQTDKIAMEPWISIIQLAAVITVLWLGIRAAREESKDKSLTYGRGVLTGFLISLYSTLISVAYTIIHLTYVNPAYVDYKMDAIRQKWIQAGMSDAQMATLEKYTRFMFTPVPMAIYLLITFVIIGVVISLILAAFLKRKSPAGGPPVLDTAPPAQAV